MSVVGERVGLRRRRGFGAEKLILVVGEGGARASAVGFLGDMLVGVVSGRVGCAERIGRRLDLVVGVVGEGGDVAALIGRGEHVVEIIEVKDRVVESANAIWLTRLSES